MPFPPVPSPRAPFAELAPPLTPDQAAQEASRCLYCYDAPCIAACPTEIDIPKFIGRIGTGDTVGAAQAILSANILGGSCARVCPVEVLCEGSCVEKTLTKKPVAIGRLQRFATDHVLSRGIDVLRAGAATGKSVGIIGAGPAGLGAAAELRKLGHAVTIYDEREWGGGLNTYAMAEYKQTAALALAEVDQVRRLGAEIRQGVKVVWQRTGIGDPAREVSFDEMLAQHNYLFVGVGLGATGKLGIPGDDAGHVREALHWIEELKTAPDKMPRLEGKRAVIIGGGNTAIDAVTQAKRLGAEATLLYRRGEENMSAYRYEIELARSMACTLLFERSPLRIEGDQLIISSPRGEESLTADLIIAAIGQAKRTEFLRTLPGVVVDDRGRLQVDKGTWQTANPRIFAGGDCVNGGKEAVNAVAEGKAAAKAMHVLFSVKESK